MVATASEMTVTAFMTAGSDSAVPDDTYSPAPVFDVPASAINSSSVMLRCSFFLLKGHISHPR